MSHVAKEFTRKEIIKMPPYIKGVTTISPMRLRNPEYNSFFGWNDLLREYHRDAGYWSVGIRIENTFNEFGAVVTKYFSISPFEGQEGDNLHNIELIPITYREWKKSNDGYTGKKTKAHR